MDREVIKEVKVEVDKEVKVEVIKEVEVEVPREVIVYVERPVEVFKEVLVHTTAAYLCILLLHTRAYYFFRCPSTVFEKCSSTER